MKNKLKGIILIILMGLLIIFMVGGVKLWSDCRSWKAWGEQANKVTTERTEQLSNCEADVNKLAKENETLKQQKAELEKTIQELNNTITNLKK
jgi:septal ring factor EnvC (AmiA/AmiB activator)